RRGEPGEPRRAPHDGRPLRPARARGDAHDHVRQRGRGHRLPRASADDGGSVVARAVRPLLRHGAGLDGDRPLRTRGRRLRGRVLRLDLRLARAGRRPRRGARRLARRDDVRRLGQLSARVRRRGPGARCGRRLDVARAGPRVGDARLRRDFDVELDLVAVWVAHAERARRLAERWEPVSLHPPARGAELRELLAFGQLVIDLNQGSIPAVLPFLRNAHGLSYAEAATIVLVGTLTSSLIQPVFGYLSDQIARRWILPASVFLAGAGLALT